MDGMTEAAMYSLPVNEMARSPIVRHYLRRTVSSSRNVDVADLATLVANAFDLHDGGVIPSVVFEVAAEELNRFAGRDAPNTRIPPMPVQRRTASLSALDRHRLDDLNRRTGMSASAAVRVATRLLAEATPLEDCEPELDALADELKATEGGREMWGYSVPNEDDEVLSAIVRSLDRGPRRPSRSEVVRLALRRTAALPDDELRRRYTDLDRVAITSTWRSAEMIHDSLIAALGNDFGSLSAEEMQGRITSVLDERVSWSPVQVDSDDAHKAVVRVWRTQADAATTPATVPIYPSDTARTIARRLAPLLVDVEDAVRAAHRAAREEKLGRRP